MSNTTSGKSMRDLSFKPRFRHNYGCNGEYFDYIVKYKEQWEDKLFYVDETEMNSQVRIEFPSIKSNEVNIPQLQLKTLEWQQLETEFFLKEEPLTMSLDQGKESSVHHLRIGEAINLKQHLNRNGLILNTGGYITSMEWLINPSTKSQEYQYLAVSVINNKDGLKHAVNNEQLSLFNTSVKSDSIKSGIQIWRYNLEANEFELYKFYLTNNYGCVSNLKWLPINIEDENILGIISGTLGDGHLHLFKIELNEEVVPEIAIVEKSSLTYFISDTDTKKSNEVIGVTCYDFLGSDKIMVGLNNGCIAEFILPFSTLCDESELNLEEPSYVQRIGESPISAIMIAKAEQEKYVVIVNTTGVKSVAFEYGNFRFSNLEAYPTNSFVKPAYNPNLKMYIGSYSIDSIGYNFIRNPQEAPNSLLKMNGMVTAIESSEVLGHPLNLTGNSYGELYIVNYSRKPLNGAKATNKTLVPLKLWQVSIDESNSLKLSGDLQVVESEISSSVAITPADIVISSISWNENAIGSSIYTAGIMAGLLILERLDPKFYIK